MFIMLGCSYPDSIVKIIGGIRYIVTLIQFIVPILLIVWGILDVAKAITAGKEDEIKKWRTALVQRIIAAVIVLIIPFLVFTLMSLFGSTEWRECWKEAQSFGLTDLIGID